VLPFRDAAAREAALAAVDGIDDALLLSLPFLDEVLLEVVHEQGERRHHWQVSRDASPVVVVRDGMARYWSLTTLAGGVTEAEEEQLPHEEVLRRQYHASVAVPVDATGYPVSLPPAMARVLHAPTPTDDPIELPALLVADFPLDASRRRVLENRRAQDVAGALAIRYASAVVDVAGRHGPAAAAALIPDPHALAGWVDQTVRDGVRSRLSEWPFVTRAADGRLVRVDEVAAFEPAVPALAGALGRHLSDLLHPDWYPYIAQLRGLGLPTRSVAEAWDVAATLPIEPHDWPAIYDVAAGLGRAELEDLPVPLADGRIVRGARGTVLPPGGDTASIELVTVLGIDCIHPDAAHSLLERLGASHFSMPAVLDERFVERVAAAADTDPTTARTMVDAAARLLARDGVAPGDLPHLGDLPVPVAGGGWHPATSVVMPGSALDAAVPPDAPRLAADLVGDGWKAIGVLADLVPVTVVERPLDPDVWEVLVPDGGSWCLAVAELAGAADPGELMVLEATVVRGVELLEGSTAALDVLSTPDVGAWLARPCSVLTVDGRRIEVPSPSAWWLGESPLLDGRCPVEVRLSGDERLAPFFPLARVSPDREALLRTLGARTTVEEWLSTPTGVDELLDELADPVVALTSDELITLYRVLARVSEAPDAPERVRACSGRDTVVVDAGDVLVAVAPHHAAVLGRPYVPGDAALADLLDLGTSDDAACGASALAGTGDLRPVPQLPVETPDEYREHEALEVSGVEVDWWVTDDGEVHAATVDGLARGLAWAAGCWSRRFELVVRLQHPVPAEAQRVEGYFDE
jgi:hypothetical protein